MIGIVAAVSPFIAIGVAFASSAPGNFISEHPDVAVWVMTALISFVCLVTVKGAYAVMSQVKSNTLLLTKVVQHCTDKCGFKDGPL